MYNEELLEHNLHPFYRGRVKGANFERELVNASCGDKIKVFLRIEAGRIVEGSWEGEGCAVSQASADVMIERIAGVTTAEAGRMRWEDEKILDSVKKSPARVACAKLAWGILGELPGGAGGGAETLENS